MLIHQVKDVLVVHAFQFATAWLIQFGNEEVMRSRQVSHRFEGRQFLKGEIKWRQMRYRNALAPGFAESSPILKMVFRHGWKLWSPGKPAGFTFHMMRHG
jgi:hypothetical protein